MIFSVLLSSALLISSASASSASSSAAAASNKQELGSSESRGYSSHSSGPPPAAYEPREPEAGYSKSRYESSEQDATAPQEDYAPKAPAKKTVILAIPVKLALQQGDREKSTSSYESSGESYGSSGGSRPAYPTSYASYADQASSAPGNSHNAPYSSGSNSNNYNNNQYELAAVVPHQNSQLNYNQQPPAYAASSSQGYVQSSPVVYAPSRDHSERPLRTYSDKAATPKPYQPDNDVDAPSSYSNSPSYDYSPKSRPTSYAAADDSSYEVEEHPRPRKTHKRPAAYVEESVDDESYSRPSPRPKYVSSDHESDAYPGLDGSTGYQSDLSDIGKTSSASLPSYASDALDESDYTSLGLQAYSSPSLPQSELSYLMSKMPRGFHQIPAASSYGLTDLPAPRPRPYPFGLPSRPAGRRPYHPGPYAPAPYLKNPYAGAAYPAPPPRYHMPAASFRSYSSIPYYGAASSPIPASSPFRLSSAVAGGLSLGKSFGSGKGLRIGPLEFGSSGSLFPSIKIKSPVRV